MAQQDPVIYEGEGPHVVMVSRLSHEKGIERAIESVAYVRSKEANVHLHVVGGGPMETVLRNIAAELGVADIVNFYGEQSNPFRYMKNADLFMMTSFHEAAPMVIDEAISLGIPVLTTRTTSSDEMVIQAEAGWVCENNQHELNVSLYNIISCKEILEEKKMILRRKKPNNIEAKKQVMRLIEGIYESE